MMLLYPQHRKHKKGVSMDMSTIILRRLVVLSFLTLFCVFVSQPLFAGTQLWEFDNNANDWKVANGNWTVEDGVYKVSRGAEAEHSLVGEKNWDNYTIEAKIRIDEHHWAGLAFRAKSEMEYYVYYMNVPDNKIELWKHTAGAWTNRQNLAQIPAVGGVQIKNGEWIEMMVEVDGDDFTLHLNGEKQSDNSDASYDAGQVGVWAWNTAASFDDFTVEGDNIEHTLAVDPNRKLTTTWGRLKRIN